MVKYRDVLKRQRMFPLSTWTLVHVGEPVPSLWTSKGTRNGTHGVPTAWLAVHCALPHLLSFKVKVKHPYDKIPSSPVKLEFGSERE